MCCSFVKIKVNVCLTSLTETQGGWSDNALFVHLYSGDTCFEFRPGGRLFLLRFSSVPLRKMSGHYLKINHDRFIPYPCQFMIHKCPTSRRYIIKAAEKASLNKSILNNICNSDINLKYASTASFHSL